MVRRRVVFDVEVVTEPISVLASTATQLELLPRLWRSTRSVLPSVVYFRSGYPWNFLQLGRRAIVFYTDFRTRFLVLGGFFFTKINRGYSVEFRVDFVDFRRTFTGAVTIAWIEKCLEF